MPEAELALLQLLTARPADSEAMHTCIADWQAQTFAAGIGLTHAQLFREYQRLDRFVVISDWSAGDTEAMERAVLTLNLHLSELTAFEPPLYRLRPLRRLQHGGEAYEYVSASLTFAPENLAMTVEQVALAEGERLIDRPGIRWTRRLRSIAGAAVVFSYSGWATRTDFELALRGVMEPVEDRIDLLGCKQVFFGLIPMAEVGDLGDAGP